VYFAAVQLKGKNMKAAALVVLFLLTLPALLFAQESEVKEMPELEEYFLSPKIPRK